jgi:protein TonB
MRELLFVDSPTPTLPRHRQSTLAIAAVVHILLFALLIVARTRPVQVHSAGLPFAGIAAYAAPAAGPSTAKAAEPKKTTPAAKPANDAATAKEAPTDDVASAAGSIGAAAGQPAGPVRLGSGGTLVLLKKVPPIYPSIMQSARMQGTVVLDAIIHADGTIGDITVLQSTNEAFSRAAIEAVKKWRYTPLPYEGIVTVTVNFTLT